MKKLATVAILSITAVGLTTGHASAWWEHFCCKNQQCIKITCKQYNAFSPFCCDGVNGATLGACPYGGCPAAYAYGGGAGYVNELPAPTDLAGRATVISPPTAGGPVQGRTFAYPGAPAPAIPPGATSQSVPNWGPGLVSPSGVPFYRPGYTGYAPGNGLGR